MTNLQNEILKSKKKKNKPYNENPGSKVIPVKQQARKPETDPANTAVNPFNREVLHNLHVRRPAKESEARIDPPPDLETAYISRGLA